MSAPSSGMDATFEELLDHLERTSQANKASKADVRPKQGPRIPHVEDNFTPEWKPLARKTEVRQLMSESPKPPYVIYNKTAGGPFEAPCSRNLKPKVLDLWTAARLVTPDRSFAKLPSQIRYHAQSEPIPEPTDDMCHTMHVEWLKKHAVARDKHLHEVYFALRKVKEAQKLVDSYAEKKMVARDLLTREQTDPMKFSERAQASLTKIKKAVHASHVFHQAASLDALAEAEAKDKAKLVKAKSVPALWLRPPTPTTQVQHLRRWAGPDKPLRSLKESTPWREQEELQALKNCAPGRVR